MRARIEGKFQPKSESFVGTMRGDNYAIPRIAERLAMVISI
jgi:hypothetical protein